MIYLEPGQTLELALARAPTTPLSATVHFSAHGALIYAGTSQSTLISDTAVATICDAPAAGVRDANALFIFNDDSASATATIRLNDNGVIVPLYRVILDSGDMLQYSHASKFNVVTAAGAAKSGAVQDLSPYQLRSEKDESDGYVGMNGFAINFHNLLGTFASLLQNTNTAIRTYLWPDKSGTVALTDDIVTDHTALSNIGTNTHAQIDTHIASTANPHSVTKTQVGLGDADNTSDTNKPVSTAQAAADSAVLAAAETYADGLVVGLWDDRGTFDASGNAYPTTGGSGAAGAIKKGDIWTISVAGALGGHAVNVGDNIRALVDSPGSTDANWAQGEANIGYVPENVASKDASGGYPGLTLFKLNLRNAANTITSWFTTAATVARTWTMPDKDGTVAMTSDITGTNSGTNTGDETAASVAAILHAATSKATPVDADELPLVDSAASNVLKKLTWANVKATLKTYFDTLTTTLTNKRITARVLSEAFSATPTINTDSYDEYHATAMSGAITSMTTNLTGTPVTGDILVCEFTDDGTPRAISWGSKYESSTIALPTTTVAGVLLTVTLKWNVATSKFRCVGVA